MNIQLLRAMGGLGGGGGDVIKSLNPIFYIKDLTEIVGGYFVDSSGNNTQIQAATTTVANDSLIMPASNTAVINALKLAHKYSQFYTNDSTPKTVLLSNLSICASNVLYCEKETLKNLTLFSSALSDTDHLKVFNQIGYEATYTILENNIFGTSPAWTYFVTAPSINTIASKPPSMLRMKYVTAGNLCFCHKTGLYAQDDYLRITLTDLDIVANGCDILIGNAQTADNANGSVFSIVTPGTVVLDNISTLSQAPTTRYIGITTTIKPTGTEIWLQSIKVEKITYKYTKGIEIFDGLFDNSISYSTGERSAKSEFSFNYDGTFLSVKANPTIVRTFPTWGDIQILVDDVHNQYLEYSSNVYKEAILPAGNKKVTLIESGLTKPSSSLLGCFTQSVKVLGTTTKINQGTISEKFLFLGDSIVNGASAEHMQQGFVNLFKTVDNKEVGILGWGFATLADFAANSTIINDTVSKIVNFFSNVSTRKVFYLELGTNDFGLLSTPAVTFLARYSALIDAIHTADATIEVFCQSPFSRGDEVQLLIDYRTGINSICSSRAWTTYINGPDVVTYNATNFGADVVHPNTTGHQAAHDYLDDIIF